MGISLEKAVEICCREDSSKIVSKDVFDAHVEQYGTNLTVEFYSKPTEKGGIVDYIFYRDIRNNDVVGFSISGDDSVYRTVQLLDGVDYRE